MRFLPSKKRDTAGNPPTPHRLWQMMILILVLITIGVVGLTVQKYIQTRRNISAAVIRQLTVHAENRLTAFVQPVMTTLAIIKRWAASGDLTLTDSAVLSSRLVPILDQYPQIYSVLIGSQNGTVYTLLRDTGGWRVFSGQSRGGAADSGKWQQLQKTGEVRKEWQARTIDSKAIQTIFPPVDFERMQDMYWTEPYELFPAGKIGLAAVDAIGPEDRQIILALPVLMSDLRDVINSVRIGDSFRLFIYSEYEVLIDFQRMDRRRFTAGSSAAAAGATGGSQPLLIASALGQWQAGGQPKEPYAFNHQGRRWWGLLHDFTTNSNSDGIGILVTESDLISQQKSERYLFVPLAFAVFWAAFLIFLRLHRKASSISTSAPQLNQLSEADLLELIASGEQERLEFKSTLRWNLKAGRAGKEIELAVLKTVAAFLNSEGGILMIGVGDNGDILGIESDQFETEDGYLRHFSSLLNQHIGLEFSKSVEFALHTINGKRVCVVACRKASQPVFVKHKKEESFYVRSGPSSRQLSLSQVLEYLKDRQASQRRST